MPSLEAIDSITVLELATAFGRLSIAVDGDGDQSSSGAVSW